MKGRKCFLALSGFPSPAMTPTLVGIGAAAALGSAEQNSSDWDCGVGSAAGLTYGTELRPSVRPSIPVRITAHPGSALLGDGKCPSVRPMRMGRASVGVWGFPWGGGAAPRAVAPCDSGAQWGGALGAAPGGICAHRAPTGSIFSSLPLGFFFFFQLLFFYHRYFLLILPLCFAFCRYSF